jgi:hypothetical protein
MMQGLLTDPNSTGAQMQFLVASKLSTAGLSIYNHLELADALKSEIVEFTIRPFQYTTANYSCGAFSGCPLSIEFVLHLLPSSHATVCTKSSVRHENAAA